MQKKISDKIKINIISLKVFLKKTYKIIITIIARLIKKLRRRIKKTQHYNKKRIKNSNK